MAMKSAATSAIKACASSGNSVLTRQLHVRYSFIFHFTWLSHFCDYDYVNINLSSLISLGS